MIGSWITRLAGFTLALADPGLALAQAAAAPKESVAPAATKTPGFDTLKGSWVRPDGGYMIVVNAVGADGRLDATYVNPNRLPFARAQASRDGTTLRVDLELRAGGYAGSTYTLAYEPASDRLRGTYYQAVAKQRFDVYFVRK
jgi:uncharacterized protein (DUF2147 family)